MQAQNVGIGTTTPQSRLHIIAPSGYTFPLLQVEKDGSTSPYLIVQPDGKVGIGVANPTEALDVSGNVQFSGALMPGGDAGTAGFVLMSQGVGNPPVWVDTALFKDNWGSQVAATQSPIVGDGTSANPIGLQGGTNAGDILIWNGTQWVIKPSPFDSVCGTAMANYVMKWTGTELCNSIIYDDGTRVGIGTSSPASSAILDVSSSDKGVLLPRLTLSGYYDTTTTVTKPDTALLVYHKGAPSMPPGYYFWDGEKWRYLYQFNNTFLVYDNLITPEDLATKSQWVLPAENVVLESTASKYVDFLGGTTSFIERFLLYRLISPQTLPSVYDGAVYTVSLTVVLDPLPIDGGGQADNDIRIGISDSNYVITCGTVYESGVTGYSTFLQYTTSGSIGPFNVIDGNIYSGSVPFTVRTYTCMFKMNSIGVYGLLVSDDYNYVRASGKTPSGVIIDPANGLWLEIYRDDTIENYRIRGIHVKIAMSFE